MMCKTYTHKVNTYKLWFIQDKNLDKLPCDEFLDALSECDSMANVKPFLQEAKKNYNKKPNKKAPCFKNKSRSKKH